jgi:FkbM family methyltransferase
MTTLHPDERLESILSESVASALERERAAFDEAASPFAQSLVIYGAGNLGRDIVHGLKAKGLDPLALVDANASLAGKVIEGIPVLSPPDAVRKFGQEATFVVSVWHPDPHFGVQQIVSQLTSLGARTALPFVPLFWKYADAFLSRYFWDLPSKILAHRSAILKAYESLDDATSKSQFVNDLELRVLAHFCDEPVNTIGKQYFPTDLFRMSSDECFIDCGAYDGDTIRELVAETGGNFRKVIAFEADPKNFCRLQGTLAALPEIRERAAIHQCAVTNKAGTLRFAATAAANASVSASGDSIVPCVGLDEVLKGESPTMIKMDIEGSELVALTGAAQVIATHKPLLAICVYHCPEHFWRIPLWLRNAAPEARLYLRSYSVDGFDSVCYAVPPGRAAV